MWSFLGVFFFFKFSFSQRESRLHTAPAQDPIIISSGKEVNGAGVLTLLIAQRPQFMDWVMSYSNSVSNFYVVHTPASTRPLFWVSDRGFLWIVQQCSYNKTVLFLYYLCRICVSSSCSLCGHARRRTFFCLLPGNVWQNIFS